MVSVFQSEYRHVVVDQKESATLRDDMGMGYSLKQTSGKFCDESSGLAVGVGWMDVLFEGTCSSLENKSRKTCWMHCVKNLLVIPLHRHMCKSDSVQIFVINCSLNCSP